MLFKKFCRLRFCTGKTVCVCVFSHRFGMFAPSGFGTYFIAKRRISMEIIWNSVVVFIWMRWGMALRHFGERWNDKQFCGWTYSTMSFANAWSLKPERCNCSHLEIIPRILPIEMESFGGDAVQSMRMSIWIKHELTVQVQHGQYYIENICS